MLGEMKKKRSVLNRLFGRVIAQHTAPKKVNLSPALDSGTGKHLVSL